MFKDDGEWDEEGGGIAQACKYEEFKRTKSGWRSRGGCGDYFATQVVVDWFVSDSGRRLRTVNKYEGGDRLVLHYGRCTVDEMASGIGVPAGELTLEHLDDLDRAAYALGYASAAVMLCPDLVYDERRAATVAIRERYDPALTYGVSADPAEGAAQIGDRKLYCAELFNRFGDNGTLIRGLLRAKSAPALR